MIENVGESSESSVIFRNDAVEVGVLFRPQIFT